MTFKQLYPITQQLIPKGTERRSGLLAEKIRFLVAHDTGNPNSTAEGNVGYYIRSANDDSASAHIFTDNDAIIECVPALLSTPEKAWHVRYNVPKDNELYGDDANDDAIGFELCYSTDGRFNNEESYKRWIWVMAYACYKFGLNPSTDIITHEILDPTRKVDPGSALVKMGKIASRNDVWATVRFIRQEVQKVYNECLGKAAPAPQPQSPNGGIIAQVRVKVPFLNIRDSASTQGAILKQAKKGQVYNVVGNFRDWHHVIIDDKRKGFMFGNNGEYLELVR